MPLRDLLRLVLSLVLLGNAGWVLAADGALTPDQVPLVQYAYAFVLSFWGGMAATLQRWSQGTERGAWWLVLWRDTVCSTLAGLLVFFLAKHYATPPMLAAVAVSVAGYGGSLVLDALLARLTKKAEPAPPLPGEPK